MKTYNIELPAEFRSGNDIPVTQATIKRERMEEILRDAIEADRQCRQSEAEEVCAEAYQVVGSLLSDLGIFETEHAEKILDNLSQAKMVHKDALPWPSFDRKRRAEPVKYCTHPICRGAGTTCTGVCSERFAAPQPAEPCVSSVSDKTACGAQNAECEQQDDEPDAATIADYEAVLSDHRRLVRELDVLLNGEEGAAEQASLCDIVAQVRREGLKTAELVKVPQPHEFNTGNEKLDALLDDTFYLAKDGGMDNGIKWYESLQDFLQSIEPVKVPSEDDILRVLSALADAHHTIEDNLMGMGFEDLLSRLSLSMDTVRVLLAHCGQQTQSIAPDNDYPTPEEEAWQRMERRS